MSTDPTTAALCALTDIADPGAKGFEPHETSCGDAVFVVRSGGRVRAYVNRCPHTGVTLEWTPDRFLTLDGTLIQCAMHGALFRIEDGLCVRGPCAGQSLTSVAAAVIDGRVVVGDSGSDAGNGG